jgi:hypothetical protein
LDFFSAVLATKLLQVNERSDMVMVGYGGLQTAYNKGFSAKIVEVSRVYQAVETARSALHLLTTCCLSQKVV